MISALHSADMSKCKAVYIDHCAFLGDSVASELASCLQAHPVSALYLKSGSISDADAEVLVQAAFHNKSLSTFCLVDIQISDTGAKAVAEAARGCRSLTTFYFSAYNVSDAGAVSVAEAVKGCPISVLFLRIYNSSDAGAISVAKTVKDCPLSASCLWGDRELSDSGAFAVAKTMKDCPLSAFSLGSYIILDAGATAVAKVLISGRFVSTLSSFCLWGDGSSDSGAKNVADAVRSCTKLSEFYLRGKPISGEALAHIFGGYISTIRSVNLYIGEISKEQMQYCLNRLQQSGTAKQLKLRFRCSGYHSEIAYDRFAAEWNGKFAEFDRPARCDSYHGLAGCCVPGSDGHYGDRGLRNLGRWGLGGRKTDSSRRLQAHFAGL